MKFKYQLHTGNPSLFTWLKLYFQVLRLVFIRFLRLCKRVLIYLKQYIPVFICIILFEISIIPIGIYLGKYTSWLDGIWDLRLFFFTSIFISVVGGVLQEEHNRHKELTKQFQAYKTFAFESEQFLDGLCLLEGIEFDCNMFLNEKQYKEFLSCVYSRIEDCKMHSNRKLKELPVIQNPHFMYSTPCVKPQTYVRIILDRYLKAINTLSQSIQQSSFIGTIGHAVSQLDYIYEDVQKDLIQIEMDSDNYTEVQLLRFTESICRCIYPAIADIRRPWRWDTKINSAMDKLLKNSICKDTF